jgi:uncharacterized protein YkwD
VRRLCSALLGCIVLSGCSISLGGTSSSTKKAAPAIDAPALATAQADFFANRYTVAEADYRKYIAAHPADSTGHAAYALFLNYNRRFSEALAEAQTAIGRGPNDVFAAAVDTRVHDWSAQSPDDIRAAARLGAAAIKLGPRSALAHVFYSETLADSGDSATAQHEIDVARPLASGAYEKAEVEREAANLAIDQADKAAQLTHLLAARTIQPDWAERTRELAEYYYAAGDTAKATAEFQHAIAMAPKDANLRVTLGTVALDQEDVATAQAAFAAANQLKPHDASIESTLGMTTFATNRDTASAEALLRAASADSPADVAIAELLEGFLRYIERKPAAADQIVVGKPPREPINPDARFPMSIKALRQATNQAALDAINAARAKAGLAAVRLDDRVTEGATSHAYWWLFNLALPDVKGLGIHKEVGGTPGFTGVSMRDRATTFGYPLASMAEDITHRGTPAGAMSDWVDSVYHRFPIMRPDLDVIGFGAALGGGLPIDVMDMGYRNEAGDPTQEVLYPAASQTQVPVAFLGNELPDPVPPGGKYPTGYPITINFNPRVSVQVHEWSVTDDTGQRVDAYTIAPSIADENVYTILPKSPLKPGVVYHVHVIASIQGRSATRDWGFTTLGPNEAAGGSLQACVCPGASISELLS